MYVLFDLSKTVDTPIVGPSCINPQSPTQAREAAADSRRHRPPVAAPMLACCTEAASPPPPQNHTRSTRRAVRVRRLIFGCALQAPQTLQSTSRALPFQRGGVPLCSTERGREQAILSISPRSFLFGLLRAAGQDGFAVRRVSKPPDVPCSACAALTPLLCRVHGLVVQHSDVDPNAAQV